MADVQDFKPLKRVPMVLAVIGWIVRFFSPNYEARTRAYNAQMRKIEQQASSSSSSSSSGPSSKEAAASSSLSLDPATLPPYRLTSIGISHYVEKVRWALSLGSRDYYEDAHAPGLHVPFTLAATNNQSTMTPLLTTYDPENPTIVDSTAILLYLSKHDRQLSWLYPEEHAARILEVEEMLDQDLGVHVRRWAYSILLNFPDPTKKMMGAELTWIERFLLPILFGQLKVSFRKMFALTKSTTDETEAKIQSLFDRVNEMLSDGREFLVGDQFTAADLTFAALSYPVIFPPAFDKRFPFDQAPQILQDKINHFRSQPAGQFALRLYRDHRFAPSTAENQRFVSTVSSRPLRASL